jgi:Uma2 family endonuclease
MALQSKRRYTYDDLLAFPEDNNRREVIDGELIVSASPMVRHQRAVMALGSELYAYEKSHGGFVLASPMDVLFTPDNVVQPDVLYVTPENRSKVEERPLRFPPDIVVEVSSPSMRRLEIVRKRSLYERFKVPEYWYVDLDADRIEVYRLRAEAYGAPEILSRGEALTSDLLPGFSVSVDEILGEPEDD